MTVTRKDYLCLRNEEFLNDVIIDFYLKYLQHGFFINDPDVQVQHLSYFSIWKLQGVFFLHWSTLKFLSVRTGPPLFH